MVLEHGNYRQYLKSVLSERTEKNPRYSLRSFSRQIGLAPNSVSEILSGKKNLSADKSISVAQSLGLKDLESEYFHMLVQFENSKNPEFKSRLSRQLKIINPQRDILDLTSEIFQLLSDWQHFAVLVLSEIPNFDFTVENIATKIKITKSEAQDIVERLYQLELIIKDPQSEKVNRTHKDLQFKTTKTNAALRKYNKKILEQAVESLENQPPADKVFATEIVAIPKSLLPKINQLTDEYLDKVLSLIKQAEEKKTDVYCIGVNIFNLTPDIQHLNEK